MAINSSGDITLEGTLTAENYVVSSSVTNQTIAGVSGSTSFGDDASDNHQFTGSLIVSGGLVTSYDGVASGFTIAGNMMRFRSNGTAQSALSVLRLEDPAGVPKLTLTDAANFDAVLQGQIESSLAASKLHIYLGNSTTDKNDHITLVGNGNVGIGETAPLGKLHVFSGDSGVTSAANTSGDDLVIEGNADTGLSILTPANKSGNIVFSREGATAVGSIKYNHVNVTGTNAFIFSANGTALTLSSTNAEFAGNVSGSSTSTGSFGHIFTRQLRGDANDIKVQIAGYGDQLAIDGAGIKSAAHVDGFRLQSDAPSATNPNILPSNSDENTGIGRAGNDALSLIAGGVEGLRVEATKISGSATSTGSFGELEVIPGNIRFNGADNKLFTYHLNDANYIDAKNFQANTSSAINFQNAVGIVNITSVGNVVNLKSKGSTPLVASGSNVEFPVANAKISGSSTSTGSFGRLNVGNGGSTVQPRLRVVDGVGSLPTMHPEQGDLAIFQHNASTSDISAIYTIAGTAGSSHYVFGDADSKNIGRVSYDHSSNAMTLHTNASEQMRINSSGNVGIGDTSPTEGKLVVSGDGAYNNPPLHIEMTTSTTFNHFANMRNSNLAAGENGIIVFGQELAEKNAAYIGYVHRSDHGDDNQLTLGFWSANNLVNLLPNGNFGIGTETPGVALEVIGSVSGSSTSTGSFGLLQTTDRIQTPSDSLSLKGNLTLDNTNIPTLHLDGLVDAIVRIDKAASYRAAHLRFDTAGSADWFIGTPDSDNYGDGDELYFGTSADTPIVAIDPAATTGLLSLTANRIIISGSAAGNQNDDGGLVLDLHNAYNADDARTSIRFWSKDSTDTYGARLRFHHNNDWNNGAGTFTLALRAYDGSGLKDVIAVDGNQYYLSFPHAARISGSSTSTGSFGAVHVDSFIGVGEKTPEADLHISNASPMIILDDEDVSNLRHRIIGGGNAGLEFSADINDVGAGYIRFDVANSEAVRIEEGGNVGIGTTNPGFELDIRAGSGPQLQLKNTNTTNGSELLLNGNRDSDIDLGSVIFQNQDTTSAYISGERAGAVNSGALVLGVHNSGTANNAFKIRKSGNIAIGAATRQANTFGGDAHVHISSSHSTIGATTASLLVEGSGSEVFSVNGTNGRLFSVNDEMSGSIFSANTVAGIPVIEATSNYEVKLDPNGNGKTIAGSTIEVTSGNISGSATSTGSFGNLVVNGNRTVIGKENGIGVGSGATLIINMFNGRDFSFKGTGNDRELGMITGTSSAIKFFFNNNNNGSTGATGLGIGGVPADNVELDVYGDIEYTGTITDVSLRSIKENIVQITGSEAGMIDKFKQVPLYKYNLKPDAMSVIPTPSNNFTTSSIREHPKYVKNSPKYGLIADDADLENAFPELVQWRMEGEASGSINTSKIGIDTTSYIGMLHGVIKELVTKVETLETQMTQVSGSS